MATNTELQGLFGNGALINKVQASLAKIAFEVSSGADTGAPYSQLPEAHTKRISWVAQMLNSPPGEAQKVWYIVLGKNSAATVTQIQNATDAAIDTNCREAVDALAEALSALIVA